MANLADHFPQEDSQTILDRVMEMWDFSWAYPLPKFKPTCICGHNDWQPRAWNINDRQKSNPDPQEGRLRWRCAVSLKCLWCGWTPQFGVAVTADYAKERLSWYPHAGIRWREALRIAEEQGYDTIDITRS